MTLLEVRLKLKKILLDRKITQKELSEKTGLRQNAISEMVNNQRSTINREQLAVICKALEITDMNEIFELILDR